MSAESSRVLDIDVEGSEELEVKGSTDSSQMLGKGVFALRR